MRSQKIIGLSLFVMILLGITVTAFAEGTFTLEEILSPPVMTRDTLSAWFSSKSLRARYRAKIVGTDVASLTTFRAAPVAPARPSRLKSVLRWLWPGSWGRGKAPAGP